jgi:hypothetical protein
MFYSGVGIFNFITGTVLSQFHSQLPGIYSTSTVRGVYLELTPLTSHATGVVAIPIRHRHPGERSAKAPYLQCIIIVTVQVLYYIIKYCMVGKVS